MCTLVALWRLHPAAPLVLALNRDELLARPTAPVSRWEGEPIVAGQDLESGGTWFGVGRKMVAALTNHRGGVGSPRGSRSRGELVVRALKAESVSAFGAELAELPFEEYGSFHLLVCDGEELVVFTNKGGRLKEAVAAPGVHVLGNFGLDDPTDAVVAAVEPAVKRALQGAPDEEELAAELKALLARHGEGWPCVHLGRFGTRSSAVLFWGGSRPRLEVAEDAPCTSPWRDESELVTAL